MHSVDDEEDDGSVGEEVEEDEDDIDGTSLTVRLTADLIIIRRDGGRRNIKYMFRRKNSEMEKQASILKRKVSVQAIRVVPIQMV
jgi:hypothetical protein